MTTEYLISVALVIPYNAIAHWSLASMGGVARKVRYTVCMGALCEALNLLVGGVLELKLLNAILQFALFPASLMLCSKSRLPRCLLASGLTIFLIFLTDGLTTAVFLAMGGVVRDEQIDLFSNPGLYLFMRVLLLAVTILLFFLLRRLWARFVDKSADGTLWYFMLFPLSQGLLVFWCGSLALQLDGQLSIFGVTSLLTLLCVAADAVLFRVMGQLRQRAEAEQRAEFLAEQLRLGQERDAMVLQEAERVAKLRHDMRNQLQTVYALLDGGEHELARAQLEGLSALMPAEKAFCENKMVGAILARNFETCRQAGIEADFSCDVPADLPVDGPSLCSLFSNLLDNAVAACRRAGAPSPWIRLRAAVRGGFFLLRCENTLPAGGENEPAAKTRRGWGQEILRDIAARYDGRLEAGPEEDRYAAAVWLKLPERTEQGGGMVASSETTGGKS